MAIKQHKKDKAIGKATMMNVHILQSIFNKMWSFRENLVERTECYLYIDKIPRNEIS